MYISVLAVYVAWFKNYVRSRTLNNAISNGGRLGSWIIGDLHVQLHKHAVAVIEGIHPTSFL